MDDTHSTNMWSLCWNDPTCVGLLVACAVGVISFGRRIGACDTYIRGLDYRDCETPLERRSARRWAAFQYVVSGSIVCGGAALGLTLIGAEQWPKQVKSVAGLVVTASVAVDFAGPLFARFLRMCAAAYIRASSQEINPATRAKFPDETGDESPKLD